MAKSQTGPKPFSWEPDGLWYGIDGQWSTFTLRTGTPGQVSHVLPSTAGYATWVVAPVGCSPSPYTAPTCVEDRGGVFHSNASKTWINQGNYALDIEKNLGPSYNLTGNYGLDTVSLGHGNTTGGPSLDSQVVAGIGSNIFYTGTFGLRDTPTNFSTMDNPLPSYLSTLKDRNIIPSLSWGYTAGAAYQNGSWGALASLTLGGYDARRFTPNSVSFSLAPDTDRDLVVGLRSIKTTSRNSTEVSLLSSPILTFIDSTVPRMILPQKVCDAFAETFELRYEPELQIYFVPEKVHARLETVNPNITFSLGNSETGGPSVDIVLPYLAFDLYAIYPAVTDVAWYFPIKPSDNESTWTLGRSFLQEAYIITNYEHQNFSVSQTRFDNLNSTKKDLVALPAATASPTPVANPPIVPTIAPSPTPEPAKSSGGLSHQAKVGVIAGTSAAVGISFLILLLILWRWRKHRANHPSSLLRRPQSVNVLQKQEMDGHGVSYNPKAGFVPVTIAPQYRDEKKPYASTTTREFDAELGAAHGNEIHEIPGPDNPDWQELMASEPPRGRDRKPKKSYAAFFSSRRAKEEERDSDPVQPPVSKFCKVPLHWLPSRGKEGGMMDLNRSLPPTPLFSTPGTMTRLTSPLPNNQRMRRNPEA